MMAALELWDKSYGSLMDTSAVAASLVGFGFT